MRAHLIIAALATITVNNPASAGDTYLETTCITRGRDPTMATVRMANGRAVLRPAGGSFVVANLKYQTLKDGSIFVHVSADNSRGRLVVSFQPETNIGLLTFKLKNRKEPTQFEAICATQLGDLDDLP